MCYSINMLFDQKFTVHKVFSLSFQRSLYGPKTLKHTESQHSWPFVRFFFSPHFHKIIKNTEYLFLDFFIIESLNIKNCSRQIPHSRWFLRTFGILIRPKVFSKECPTYFRTKLFVIRMFSLLIVSKLCVFYAQQNS